MKYDIKEPDDLIKQQCTDGMKWAEQFVQTLKKQKWDIKDIDEGLMVAWFASAIVTAQDALHNGHTPDLTILEEKLSIIIDDIDTASDIAKDNNALYRNLVHNQLIKFGHLVSSDGQTFTKKDRS